jgi:dTDP-4-dehydrorhamnose 3,5-epimerase
MMKVVLYDSRPGSKTKGEVMEIFMGEHSPVLVQIPRDVYHGFKCVSEQEAMIINIPTEAYNYKKPDEYRLPAHTKKIPYKWDRIDG